MMLASPSDLAKLKLYDALIGVLVCSVAWLTIRLAMH